MDDYYLDYFYGLEADEFSFIRVPKLKANEEYQVVEADE